MRTSIGKFIKSSNKLLAHLPSYPAIILSNFLKELESMDFSSAEDVVAFGRSFNSSISNLSQKHNITFTDSEYGFLFKKIKEFFDELKNELEFEKNNTLTNLLHAEILNYYLDIQDFITDEFRDDIKNIMTALVKPYTDNNDLISHITPIVLKLHSEELRMGLMEILRRHSSNPFNDHYISILIWPGISRHTPLSIMC